MSSGGETSAAGATPGPASENISTSSSLEDSFKALALPDLQSKASTNASGPRDPENTLNTDEKQILTSSRRGGTTTDADKVNEILRGLASPNIREKAAAFLKTMPCAWDAGDMTLTRGLLKNCAKGMPQPRYSEDLIFRAIVFRYQYLRLTDRIITRFDLARPSGKIAMLWNSGEWMTRTFQRQPKLHDTFNEYLGKNGEAGFMIMPTEAQFARVFSPPRYYLAAAFVDASLSEKEGQQRVDAIGGYMKTAEALEALAQTEILGVEEGEDEQGEGVEVLELAHSQSVAVESQTQESCQ
jgi:hypothetical protein